MPTPPDPVVTTTPWPGGGSAKVVLTATAGTHALIDADGTIHPYVPWIDRASYPDHVTGVLDWDRLDVAAAALVQEF